MAPRVQYPAEGGDLPASRQRKKQHRMEVKMVGRTDPGNAPLTTPDSGRIRHGRLIQPGVRPTLRVSGSSRFMAGLTERQRRRGKVRTARSWGRMMKMMQAGDMTMAEFVETLDAEELVRGQLKDHEGTFRGRPPAWVPREFHRACIRELMRRGQTLWQGNYLQAIQAMTKVATGQVKGVTPGEMIKAAQFVIERIEGKVPERVQVVEDSPWQVIIEDIVSHVPDAVAGDAAEMKAIAGFPDVVDGAVVVEATPVAPPPRRRAAARKGRS